VRWHGTSKLDGWGSIRPHPLAFRPVPNNEERGRYVFPGLHEPDDALLAGEPPQIEEVLSRTSSPGGSPREVRFDPDSLGRPAALHVLVFDESAHGQEEVGSGKGAEPPMKGERGSKSPAGRSRSPVATVEHSSPGQVSEARFAELAVPKEGGRKAEKAEVVQRKYDGHTFSCSRPKHGG
jgi:hypothetical protein